MDISKLTRLACVLSALCCPAEGLAPCPVGFMPPECQEQCGSGSFGVNCASLCPATCMGGSCRPDTGFCYRCQAGFTGPKCSLKCRTGFFGEGCKRSCPSNCFQKACDPFTGFCERCLKGYGGVKCDQRAVLLNSSVQSEMVDDSHASGTMASTDRSIVVYVLVVVVCCVLPVCAVVLCVKCAKKLSSRNVQQDEKAPTSDHTPVSWPTHPRRPGRLSLKYEQMQTIEEESSNQLTLDEDIHQRAASNPTAASATTMNGHAGFYTPSQNYTFESLQATALNFTNRKIHSNDLYNYQAMEICSKDCNPNFDFSHTTKEIQEFEAGDVYNQSNDVYNQSNDVCIQFQSTPAIDLGNDVANNLILTDHRSHKSAQASRVDTGQCMYDRDGSVLSLNSDTFPLRPYSPTSGTRIELAPEILRRVSSSALAGAHMRLTSEMSKRVPSSAMAESHIELVSETPRLGPCSAMADSHMELVSETPRLGPCSAMADSHMELVSETPRLGPCSAMADSHMELASQTPRRGPSSAVADSQTELASETHRLGPSSAMAGTYTELAPEMPRRDSSSSMAGSHMELASETPRHVPSSAMAESHTGLTSEMFRRDSSAAIAETHMKFTSEAPGCILSAAIAGTHTEPTSKAAMCMLPRATTAVDVHPIGHLDPETTVRILRSECYSSSQEFMPLQSFTQDTECADLVWHQAQAIRQADNADGDMVALGLPADTGASNQECTSHEAAPVPFVEVETHGKPKVAQSVGQPTLSDNDHVLPADAFPWFSTGVCTRDRTPGATGVCTRDRTPGATGVCTGDRKRTPDAPADNEESEPGGRMRSLASLASLVSDNRPIIASVSFPVSISASPAVSIPASHAVCIPASPPVCIPVSIPASHAVCIPASPPVCIPVSIPASSAVCIPASPAVCIPASPPVCIPVSIPASPAACIPVSIPATPAECIPVSIPVSADVTTALIQCCHFREEEQILLDVSAQDAARRHIRSIDYTHLRVRQAFECATDGYNVLQDSAPNDLAVEEENIQAPEHDDQHSGDVCESAGQTISSSTEQDASARDVSVNGSANNTNRWHVQTRQPQSSSTTASSTPGREIRHTPFLHLGCTKPIKLSVLKETSMSQRSVPLFSICSSAPVNLKLTCCKEAYDDQKPTRRDPAPRFSSMSSLDLLDDCPPQSFDPLELSVRLSSPPKHCQTKCSKGRRSGESRHGLETQICLQASKPDISHQHKLPAFKCDQFRQVLYRQDTPCTQRTISLKHLSVGKNHKIMKKTCRKYGARSVTVSKKHPHGSHASNYACPFVPVSRALDENPLRKNVVPETRNIEPLTPANAIKMSVTQTADRDVPQLHTSNRGTDNLPSTLTNDQEAQQGGSSPALKPLTFYIVETPLTSKDIGPLGPCVDKRTSNWSKNSHFLLRQGLRQDGDLGRPGADELARTCVPNTGLLPARGQPTDDIRNSSHVVSSNASSTPGDTTRQSTNTDDSAKVKSRHVACRPPTALTNNYPDLRELGSSRHRSSTVTIDSLWHQAVTDDPSMTAELPASGSRRANPPTSSQHEVNVAGRQAVDEMMPTQVKVQVNMSTTDEGNQSGTPGHDLPPNMYPGYVKLPHNPQGTGNCAHKAKSGTGVPQILKSADLDSLTLYPLPSLLEGLAIWERTVSAVETNTEPCLLPVQDCNIMVGHPATERAILKTTDYGRRQSDGNIVCLGLCPQERALSYQFSHHDDKRLKPKPTICSRQQNIDGAAPSAMVGRDCTSHLPAGNSGSIHRLSECCKSKSCNKLSPEKSLCCRKESTEGIQLTQEQPFCCSKVSLEGSQLPQDKPVHCKNSSSERNQLLQQKLLCRRKESLEGIQLSQDKHQCCRQDNSEGIQLSQVKDQCCRQNNSEGIQLSQKKLQCCGQDNSEGIQLSQVKYQCCRQNNSEGIQLSQKKHQCCRQDNSEGIQLSQVKDQCCRQNNSEGIQLSQKKLQCCEQDNSEGIQLSQVKHQCCRQNNSEGIQLSQKKLQFCGQDNSEGIQLSQVKHQCCRQNNLEDIQLSQKKLQCCGQDNSEGIQLSQVKHQCCRQDNSEGIQLSQKKLQCCGQGNSEGILLSQDKCQCCRRNRSQSNKLTKEKRQCCQQDSSEYISIAEDSCDIFFDALDSFPVAFPPSANFKLQGHNDGLIMTRKDRKRAVKFMEIPARKTSDVEFSAKYREHVSRRQEREASHKENERLNYCLSKRQTPQQNIAFRFAVPTSADSTMNTFQTSATTIAKRKRRYKRMYPTEEKDQVANQPTNRHGKMTSAKVSLYEQTEQKSRPLTQNRHSGSDTDCSLVDAEGTVSTFYFSVASEKGSCSVGDQQSIAEDFFSICD